MAHSGSSRALFRQCNLPVPSPIIPRQGLLFAASHLPPALACGLRLILPAGATLSTLCDQPPSQDLPGTSCLFRLEELHPRALNVHRCLAANSDWVQDA